MCYEYANGNVQVTTNDNKGEQREIKIVIETLYASDYTVIFFWYFQTVFSVRINNQNSYKIITQTLWYSSNIYIYIYKLEILQSVIYIFKIYQSVCVMIWMNYWSFILPVKTVWKYQKHNIISKHAMSRSFALFQVIETCSFPFTHS